MTNTAVMERTWMGTPGMTVPGMGTPTAMPTGMNWMAVPRCTFKVEKCQGGVKITCSCEDKTAASMVQNLCTMMQGGMCSCCCMVNGMMVCCCNFTMCICKCEATKDGVCVTCTSGDPKCCEMLQACGDCLVGCLKAGCTCCLMMNGTPVCCGC